MLSLSRLEFGNVFRATFFFRSWVCVMHLHKGFPGVFELTERKEHDTISAAHILLFREKDDLSRGICRPMIWPLREGNNVRYCIVKTQSTEVDNLGVVKAN